MYMNKLKTVGAVGACTGVFIQICTPGAVCDTNKNRHDYVRFKEEIAKVRLLEENMRQQWIDDEKNFRKLPARAWPQYQPNADELPTLRMQVKNNCWNEKDNSNGCLKSRFNLSTALLFNVIDQEQAMKIYELLADMGDIQGMTALGTFQIEGLGCEQNLKNGSEHLRKAAELGYSQALYELGVLHYNGNAEPYVDENNIKAFHFFELAAAKSHIGGMFMVADMLITGEGGVKDYPRAIPLLLASGNLGHRTSRATLLDILNNEEDIVSTIKQNSTNI